MDESGGSGRAGLLSRLPGLVGIVATVLLLVSCGGGSGEGPSVDPSRTPVLPSSTAGPSETSSPGDQDSPSESPADSPTRTRTPRSTATVTTTADESSESPSQEPSEEPSDSEEDAQPQDDSADEPADVPAWAWWLAALAILVAVVAIIILVRRSRRRGAWAAEFATVVEEVAWFTKVLLPQLAAGGSIQQAAGGWAVGESRVAATEDRLTSLEATAPNETDRMRARALRDAVRAARQDVDRAVAPAAGAVPTGELIAVGVRLEDAQAAAKLGTP